MEPGTSSIALLPTNQKSTVGQCRGRGLVPERGRREVKPMAGHQEVKKGREKLLRGGLAQVLR